MSGATETKPDTRVKVAGHPLPWRCVHCEEEGDLLFIDDADGKAVFANLDHRQRDAEGEPIVPDSFYFRLVEDVNRLAEDTTRLDWLDAQTDGMNRGYGTTYGWKVHRSHNGVNISDGNLPALTVRQAIDTGRFPGRELEILRSCDRETLRREEFRKRFPGQGENARKSLDLSLDEDAKPYAGTSNVDLGEMLRRIWLNASGERRGLVAQAIHRLARADALEAALVSVASMFTPDWLSGRETAGVSEIRDIFKRLGLADRLPGNPTEAEEAVS